MSNSDVKKKWNNIYEASNAIEKQAAEVLTNYAFLLPKTGIAVDLACGLGANAIFLAKHGLTVHAWDISDEAIKKLNQFSKQQKTILHTKVCEVEEQLCGENIFDVICCCYFLERSIVKNIIQALRPNGLLFFQTFIHEKVSDVGPTNPSYRLAENELLHLFSPLHALVYHEHGRVGELKQGIRDVALLIAQKR